MATVRSRSLTPSISDDIDSILAQIGETEYIYYVSTDGSDDNDGSSLETAFRTLSYAITQVTSGLNYYIFMEQGTYDESSLTGVLVNKPGLTIQGIKSPVTIQNTNSGGGTVLHITANNTTLVNIQVKKGETTSSGSTSILIDGAANPRFRDVKIILEKIGFYGYRYIGGAHGGFIGFGDRRYSLIISEATTASGIGIYFENCYHVIVEDLCVMGLEKGFLFGENGDNNGATSRVTIGYCTTGIELESGASNNGLCPTVVAATTDVLNNSGNATNDFHTSITNIYDNITHIPKFTGIIWFVDITDGSDTYSGRNPHEAFATIGNAINNASEGDAITIKAGDYYETNLNLNLIGLEIWGEIGVNIYNMTGTGLTISARNCRVNEIVLVTPGQTAVELSGNYCVLSNITCAAPAVGLSVSGQGNRIENYIVGAPTTTGIDVSGPYNIFREIFASNEDVAARGFYLSASTAILNVFEGCHSIGNTTAGFETVLGADHNSFLHCSSGGGDGKRLDLGYHNLWVIEEQLTTEHNEQMHPMSDGEGTAALPITVDNTATDDTPDTRSDRWYWGDTVAIILPNVLTTFWNSIGIYIFATTTNKTCQWQIWFPNAKFTTTRNGGLAWNLGQTVITVADASLFLANDLIWMRSTSNPDGEILEISNIAGNVITVASETRFSGNTGIRYNHAGGETIYLIGRTTDDQFTSIEGGYAAGSSKDSFRTLWHHIKELPGNSAMIMRVLNTLDNLDVEFDVTALYEM